MGDIDNSISLAELADAFDRAPLGLALIDERGRIRHANAALAQMLGYDRDDLIGKTVADLTHPEDLEESLAHLRPLCAGESEQFSIDKRYLHRDGHTVWARVHLARMTTGSRTHHLLHVADITREKQADEALRASEERFREMTAAIDQDFWMMSLDPLKLLYTSPAARRIWGFDPDDNRDNPQRIVERIHPEDFIAFGELFGSMLRKPREREYRIIRPDGAVRWLRSRVFPVIDANGAVYRIAGVTEDVTARKQAECEVERHRAFERLVLKLTTTFVNVSADGVQARFNTALRELGRVIGADRGAIFLLDDSSQTLTVRYDWHADTSPRLRPFDSFAFAPDSALRAMLVRDGLIAFGSVTEMPDSMRETRERLIANGVGAIIDVPLMVRDQLVGLLGFGTIGRTNTWAPEVADLLKIAAEMFSNALERVRSEEAIRNHREALAHALRLGTMGQLASNIAHELNQPLAAILTYVQACEHLLTAREIDGDHLRAALRKIAEQTVRASDVIKSMRALVRKGEGRRAWHDPNELVRTALRLLEPEIADLGISLVAQQAAALPRVQVDPIQIEQVVLNLVRNAIDALVPHTPQPREVCVATALRKPNAIEISVRDNGSGVDPRHAEFIFDEFYTTKADGLGLGLAISKSIVEAHGGEIWMDASSRDGTMFRFTLPAAVVP